MCKFRLGKLSWAAIVLVAFAAGCGREQAPSPAFPMVVVAFPVNGATDVATKTIVTAGFSSVMNPLTINTKTFTLTGPGASPVVGAVTLCAIYIRKLSEADNVRQGFFSEEEIRNILTNLPNDGLRDFVDWAACTGQRKGEIASLTWDMVDGDELRIPGEICKNRRPRVIPLGPELAEIIARRKKARCLCQSMASPHWLSRFSIEDTACPLGSSRSRGRRLQRRRNVRGGYSMIFAEHARGACSPRASRR